MILADLLQHALTVDELRRLLTTCADDLNAPDCRDRAFIWLSVSTGWQPGVLLDLDTRGVVERADGGMIRIRDRIAGVGGSAWAALDWWLAWVAESHVEGHVFCALRRVLGRHALDDRLGVHGLRKALKARAREAGIPDFTPRRLRYTFALLASMAGWTEREIWARMRGVEGTPEIASFVV